MMKKSARTTHKVQLCSPVPQYLFSSLALITLALSGCSSTPETAPARPSAQTSSASQTATASASDSDSSPASSPAESLETASPSPSSLNSPTVTEATPLQTPQAPAQAPQSQQLPQPSETPVHAINPPGSTVGAGNSCGLSNTGRTTLVVAEGEVSCTEVQQTFTAFNAQFTGSTANITIGDYLCRAYSQSDTAINGRTVTCLGKGNRLEAMLQYPP